MKTAIGRLLVLPILWAFFASCQNVSPYPLDTRPTLRVQKEYLGIWGSPNDKDEHNYFVVTNKDAYNYNITYMDRGGSNRTYENFRAYFSEVGGQRFLNITYVDDSVNGYMLLKIINFQGTKFSATMVEDSTLGSVKSITDLRMKVARNMNNPRFYGDTIHFVKKLPLEYCNCR